MTPLQQYQHQIQAGKIQFDPSQHEVVLALDKLYLELLSRKSLKSWFLQEKLKGIYLWGGVGRGKTFLMDLFYQTLPIKYKTRLHFHHFMVQVHHALKEMQGKSDPLKRIAKDFIKHIKVLCFDEFYVSDIADAMILAELFRHLFEGGVTLVATSNLKPEDLYQNGLQRDKFLPTIELINTHTQVLNLLGEKDYRMQVFANASLYLTPLNETANDQMLKMFNQLVPHGIKHQVLTIVERKIQTQMCGDSVVWFSFAMLCETHRSTLDYIDIASCYHTVIISGVKRMDEANEDVARRFIALVDEFYERHVTLIISAEVPISELYQGKRHEFEFKRTISRLTEMQTTTYLSLPHLP